MAFRGYRDGLEQETSGNVLLLIKFTAKFGRVLQEHLKRTEDNGVHDHCLGKTFNVSKQC
jgi:hypothetical protein